MTWSTIRKAQVLRRNLGKKIKVEDPDGTIETGVVESGFMDKDDDEFVECVLQPKLTENYLHTETGKRVFRPGYYLVQPKKVRHLPLKNLEFWEFNGIKKIGEVDIKWHH